MAQNEFINANEFFETRFKDLVEQRSQFPIRRELRKGDLLQKGLGFYYEIDDENIGDHLIPEQRAFPYGPIYRALRTDALKIKETIQQEGRVQDGKVILPFSNIVLKGLGECLEKSILAHLCLQKLPEFSDKFLIPEGGIHLEGENAPEHHAFNVVRRDGTWCLIDVENPHAVYEDRKTAPYIVRIEGVNPNDSFRLSLDPQANQGRSYFLK